MTSSDRVDMPRLMCDECATVTYGHADLWIALLVPDRRSGSSSDVAIFCPRCAEACFQFFSRPPHPHTR